MRQYIYMIGMLLCLLTPQAGWGQQAEPLDIRLMKVPLPFDKEWYQEQERLWKAELKKDKKNEKAWENYYFACRGQYDFFLDDSLQKAAWKKEEQVIYRKMKRCIPKSRIYKQLSLQFADGKDKERLLEELLALEPTTMDDYVRAMTYCMQQNREEKLIELSKAWYRSGLYSTDMLFYFYNELSGLPENAILMSDSNLNACFYYLLKYGAGLFKGIEIVEPTDLMFPTPQATLWKKLGIDTKEIPSWNKMKCPGAWYLTEKLRRPVYCTQLLLGKDILVELKNFLYSEGLVLRYSLKPYNNLAVTRKNYEQNYQLDYLRRPVAYDRGWRANSDVRKNYIVSLSPLLRFYDASGDKSQADRLRSLLQGILDSWDTGKQGNWVNEEEREYIRLMKMFGEHIQQLEAEGKSSFKRISSKAQYQQLIDPVKP